MADNIPIMAHLWVCVSKKNINNNSVIQKLHMNRKLMYKSHVHLVSWHDCPYSTNKQKRIARLLHKVDYADREIFANWCSG